MNTIKPDYIKILETIDIKPYLKFLKTQPVNWNHGFNKWHNRDQIFINVQAFPLIDEYKIFPLYDKFYKISSQIRKVLKKHYGEGKFYKIHFSRMTQDSECKKHRDLASDFPNSHRLHVPLKTNKKVVLEIGDKQFTPKVGTMFEINNSKTHTVKVEGKQERLTLILDYLN
tara:strand:+ start:111 stop:623 length:513 start_codon:yes stop_codon:yes gene_type:complete